MRIKRLKDDEYMPDEIQEDIAFIQTTELGDWAMTFSCPCGTPKCEVHIMLDSPATERFGGPKWKMTLDGDIPTLTPSLLRRGGCQSHFFVTNGEVRKC